MAVGGNVDADLKRAQIISLLYIIFVCFSVLNIKISILDSNYYSIKSFDALDKENRKKIDLSNIIIKSNFNRISTAVLCSSFFIFRDKQAYLYQ